MNIEQQAPEYFNINGYVLDKCLYKSNTNIICSVCPIRQIVIDAYKKGLKTVIN